MIYPGILTVKSVAKRYKIKLIHWNEPNETRSYFSEYTAILSKAKDTFYGAGGSINKNLAKLRAIFESIEHYCGTEMSYHSFKRCSWHAISKNKTFLHPQALILFSEEQYREPSFSYQKFNPFLSLEWIRGISLITHKKKWIPAFAVFLRYNSQRSKEIRLMPSISSGLAVGRNLEEAIVKGALELIERDSAMVSWLFRLRVPIIKLDSGANKKILYLVEKIKRENLELKILLSTLDIEIPAVIAILYNENSKNPPYASFGLSADFNLQEAILKSIEEALMVRRGLERFFRERDNVKKVPSKREEIKTFLDHALFYSLKQNEMNWKFWLKGPKIPLSVLEKRFKFVRKSLDFLIRMLRAIALDILFVDLTTPIAQKLKVKAVKVIIPGIHLMDFDYNSRFLGGLRLNKFKKILNKSINQNPHPFS